MTRWESDQRLRVRKGIVDSEAPIKLQLPDDNEEEKNDENKKDYSRKDSDFIFKLDKFASDSGDEGNKSNRSNIALLRFPTRQEKPTATMVKREALHDSDNDDNFDQLE